MLGGGSVACRVLSMFLKWTLKICFPDDVPPFQVYTRRILTLRVGPRKEGTSPSHHFD